jgi:STE24 endopeptidase
VKSTLLSLLLLGLLTAGALALIQASPQHWWLWVWALVALVTLFLMYLSPYVIEPLFYKFEPVRDEGLRARIAALMEKAGLRVSRVQQVDASRRSRHSNAYFTGIGRVKRIVLFDTLLEQMTPEEILAILAHEAGHWKKGHIRRRLWSAELLSLAAFFIGFHLLQWGGLPQLLGIEQASFFAQVVILGFLGSLVSFPLTPFGSWLSRRHERQADRFAVELTRESERSLRPWSNSARRTSPISTPIPFTPGSTTPIRRSSSGCALCAGSRDERASGCRTLRFKFRFLVIHLTQVDDPQDQRLSPRRHRGHGENQ